MQDLKAAMDISAPARYLHICYTQSHSAKGPPVNPICQFMHSIIKIYFYFKCYSILCKSISLKFYVEFIFVLSKKKVIQI